MKWAYYNENDPYCCEWLRNLIRAGLIADGEVDGRSIKLVQPDDVRGFAQAHFFAGIGGWSYACRLAGWPDDRKIWTGSPPCQPFSSAGKRRGTEDERHLWPDFFRLIRSCRPSFVMGEQTSGKAGYGWLDGVRSDLAGEGYASRGVDIPACAVDAPHIRSRLYWVAVADVAREPKREPQYTLGSVAREWSRTDTSGSMCGSGEPNSARANTNHTERRTNNPAGVAVGDGLLAGLSSPEREAVFGAEWRQEGRAAGEPGRALGEPDSGGWEAGVSAGRNSTFWSDAERLAGADGKARRVGQRIRWVDHGLPAGMDSLRPTDEVVAGARIPLFSHGEPARVGKLKALGNAIVPQLAAEAIRAFMECSAK